MSTNDTWGLDCSRCWSPEASSTLPFMMFEQRAPSTTCLDLLFRVSFSFRWEPAVADEAWSESDFCADWCETPVQLRGVCFEKAATRGLAFARGCKLISLTNSKSLEGCKLDDSYNCWDSEGGAWCEKFVFATSSDDRRGIRWKSLCGLEGLREIFSKARIGFCSFDDGMLETSKRFKDFSAGNPCRITRPLKDRAGTDPTWGISLDSLGTPGLCDPA